MSSAIILRIMWISGTTRRTSPRSSATPGTASGICEAYAQQRLPVGYRLDDPAIGEHKRKQAAQIKREREKLAAWTTPFEDREPEEAASTARPVAGALEIGALTVKGERKVVALPADRQYREEQKARRQKPARSEYLDRRGAAALEKIKNLG